MTVTGRKPVHPVFLVWNHASTANALIKIDVRKAPPLRLSRHKPIPKQPTNKERLEMLSDIANVSGDGKIRETQPRAKNNYYGDNAKMTQMEAARNGQLTSRYTALRDIAVRE